MVDFRSPQSTQLLSLGDDRPKSLAMLLPAVLARYEIPVSVRFEISRDAQSSLPPSGLPSSAPAAAREQPHSARKSLARPASTSPRERL